MDSSWRVKITVLAVLPLFLALLLGIHAESTFLNQTIAKAQLCDQEGMIEVAAEEWAQAASLQPWRGDLWEQAGLAAWRNQDYFHAEVFLFKAEQTKSLRSQGTIALIDSLFRTGNQQLAFMRLNGIGTDPTRLTTIYQPLVMDHLRHGDVTAAVVLASHWQKDSPENAQANYFLGLGTAITDPYEALIYLKNAAQLDPSYQPTLEKFEGMLSARGNEWEASLKDLSLAKFYIGCGEWKLAERAAMHALEENMNQAETWAYLGEIRQHLGLDGLAELQRAEELNPESVVVKGLTALYWQRHDQPEQALVYFHAAAQLEPENPVWQFGLANTLVALNQIAQAEIYYEKANTLSPQNLDYATALAEYAIQYHTGLPDLALKAARQVISIAPDQPASYDLMGQVFYEVEDLDNAQRFFQRSIQVDPDYAPAHIHLGWVYFKQNRLSDAQTEWKLVSQSQDVQIREQALKLLQQYFSEK